MLFNSFQFLLGFLPVSLIGFFLLARRSHGLAAWWLALMSLVFYAYWSYAYLPLLIGSVCFNYWAGLRIVAASGSRRRIWLTGAIVVDLGLLGYYKYADFLLSSISVALDAPLPILRVVLPIGISFFTFTQIAFLVDAYQGRAKEYRFSHYLLFVTYFPHLIAGPILHHGEMMPQFSAAQTYRWSYENFAVGTAIFVIGLAKKVLVADNLAPYVADVFDATAAPSLLIAWGGVLAYAFQLYFDFSGYCDMAIGLSRLFGVRLPLNFDSPYKAPNITEFWRRWHMTLSRFLRDYLYIPLGGNRKGPSRRAANLMVTMLLGGLWHGAGWNFVIWGGLHGLYLVVHHTWASVVQRMRIPIAGTGAGRILATALTFLAVCLAWVFFRAKDLQSATALLAGMGGAAGVGLPEAIVTSAEFLGRPLHALGVRLYAGGGARFLQMWAGIVGAALIVFWMPNTQQIMAFYAPALGAEPPEPSSGTGWRWRPRATWAAALAVLGAFCLLSLNRPSEFLYFQF